MSFPSIQHDHSACVEAAIKAAERECLRQGARLTPVRKRVLELVWNSHQPVGAYAILDMLRQSGISAVPPTVYRALDFLLAHSLIHRIERRDAFVGCPRPGIPHTGHFLLCGGCGRAAELDDPGIEQALAKGAERLGFSVRGQTLELEGYCPVCRESGNDRTEGRRSEISEKGR